jgi:hypothetical protein
MGDFRKVVADAPDEAAIVKWLAVRVDPDAAPGLNAKLESFVVDRMSPENQVLIRRRHPVMATRPDLSKVLDILDAEDDFSFSN